MYLYGSVTRMYIIHGLDFVVEFGIYFGFTILNIFFDLDMHSEFA